MRKLFVLALIIVTTNAVFAQEFDRKAQAILDKVSVKYNAIKNYQTDFIVNISNPDAGIEESEVGRLWVKGESYRFKSEQMERMTDGKTIWTHFIPQEEMQVTEPDPEDNELTPTKIFSLYKTGFIYLFIGEEDVDGQICNIIDLTPVDKDLPYFKIRLTIDKASNSIHKVKAFGSNGTKLTYEISNFDARAVPKKDDFFVFNREAYSDELEIIDLR